METNREHRASLAGSQPIKPGSDALPDAAEEEEGGHSTIWGAHLTAAKTDPPTIVSVH